eukprot:27412-Eustigmatos_ZCMA.PRE.1
MRSPELLCSTVVLRRVLLSATVAAYTREGPELDLPEPCSSALSTQERSRPLLHSPPTIRKLYGL